MLTETKINHRNAWTTDHVRSKSDIAYALSDSELADLDQALAVVKQRGMILEDVVAEDFPLGGLEP
ncbi:MAG: hypothetical protein GY889_10025, partial [Proteobacteria bacterium]|nr:hypothetical protein [Pseudomonadota bacterium]